MPASDRTYPSVWARPPRQERSTLTRELIVAEALRLLDTEGVEALSMRKLAAALGAGATSLYWHVANRDELIELVVDEIYGEIEVPDPGDVADWREAARRFARSARATAVRHRWIVSVLDQVVAAHMGPNVARMSERALAMFESAGFDLREAERALNTLSAYMTGVAFAEAAFQNRLERTGQSAEDWMKTDYALAEQAVDGSPRMREILADYEGKDPQEVMEDDFEYGLERVLDGLEAHLRAG